MKKMGGSAFAGVPVDLVNEREGNVLKINAIFSIKR